jgi:hypothetical protein
MDSVYDAALAHAEKLKAELETLQKFLDLHDHFRDHFGLTPSKATAAAAPLEAEAAAADQAGETHEIHVQELGAEAQDAIVEAPAPALSSLKTTAPATVQSEAVEPEAVDHQAPVQAAIQAPAVVAAENDSEDEPRVINASEGVLIAASSEPEADAPLGPEATLQSVAEKLAATISASHPTVTGYTV